jgi:hypothetical protein
MDNICHYSPIINLSLRELNRRFETVHKYLCFVASGGAGGGDGSDGLSNNVGGDVVLGQDAGAPGDPAILTSDREIPTGGFFVSFQDDTSGATEVSAGSIFMHSADGAQSITLNTSPNANINIRDDVGNPTIAFTVTNPAQIVFASNASGVFSLTNNTLFNFDVDVVNQEVRIDAGDMGIRTSPTAYLHLGAGTATANTAPLKFTAGTNLGVIEDGAMEFDGISLFISAGGTRTNLTNKENALLFTAPLSRSVNTISITDAAADGATKGISTFAAADFNAAAGVISIDYANGQAATASVNGFMTTGTQAFAGNKTWGGTSTFNNTFTVGGTVNGSIGISSSGASVRGNIDLSSNNPRLNSQTGIWIFAQVGTTIGSYNSTGWFFGGGTTPANAIVQILAGSATVAPLKLNSGINLTTPVNGCMEYNGTNLFFTRAGAVRESVLVGVGGAAAPTTTAGAAITNFYGTAATNFLGDPNQWASVVIGGTTFKIPLYT